MTGGSGLFEVSCHCWAAAELISAPAASINGKNATWHCPPSLSPPAMFTQQSKFCRQPCNNLLFFWAQRRGGRKGDRKWVAPINILIWCLSWPSLLTASQKMSSHVFGVDDCVCQPGEQKPLRLRIRSSDAELCCRRSGFSIVMVNSCERFVHCVFAHTSFTCLKHLMTFVLLWAYTVNQLSIKSDNSTST